MQSLKLLWLQHGAWAVVTVCAAAVAFLAFLAFLAYFLFYPLFRRAHEAISVYLTRLKQRHESAKQNRTALLTTTCARKAYSRRRQ
jgi:Na+/melibiose symporter-like transporter